MRRPAPLPASLLTVGFLLLPPTGLLGCGQGSAAGEELPFDAARAWSHLEAIVAFGERPSGSPALERLRGYLEQQLASLGLEPVRESFEDDTPIGRLAFTNLWVDLPPPDGGTPDGPLIVVMTHIDTKRLGFRFVGANDGGSGTATLLELARVLSRSRRDRDVTYRLLFLDGEEAVRPFWDGTDNTYGSRHHVAALRAAGQLARVKACILLDMVGDADLQLTTERSSTPALLAVFFATAKELGLGKHVDGPAQELSDDHLPFLAAGVPSVDLIDFRYGPANSYWHQREDTLENCSAESLGVVGRIVVAGLPLLELWLAEAARR